LSIDDGTPLTEKQLVGLISSWLTATEPTTSVSHPRRFAHINTAVLASVVFLAAMGCEKPPYDMAPVRGTVTIDGRPLSDGRVMFAPVGKGELNSGKPAYGRIDSDGSFFLYTYGDDDGAIVGEHGVTVINTAKESADANAPKFTRVSLPRRFQVVAGQDNQIDIDISKLELAQYGR
jgi:hypothetical protein